MSRVQMNFSSEKRGAHSIPEFCVPFGESGPIVVAFFFFLFLERIIEPLSLHVIQINLTLEC